MIRAGIIGGAGYTGGELIRLLQSHSAIQIEYVSSRSQADKEVSSVHTDLFNTPLVFTGDIHFEIDVLFLCSGHGRARAFMAENQVPDRVKIIDLSHDFRIEGDHNFTYGLPELNREKIRIAQNIANPGCFATAIQLGLLPAVKNKFLAEDVHIHAITGSTGAGQNPSPTGHFSWRNNNVSVYKAFNHQHLAEINQSFNQLDASQDRNLHFVPVRGNFTRGIFASMYWETNLDAADIVEQYQSYYQDHPFVHISSSNPHLKSVVNTNFCLLHIERHGQMVHVISMIDNLIKGASGQAVQNCNLIFDLSEKDGLSLKGSIY